MLHSAMLEAIQANTLRRNPLFTDPLKPQPLSVEHEMEVLAFLAERPVHTVIMASFIRDNGVVSRLHRGTFYACRDCEGRLEGVALIGHHTLTEARSAAALQAFARLAQDYPLAHMIMGEQEKVSQFWRHYAEGGQQPRLACRELLLEQRWPIPVRETVPGLRLATLEDLPHVMPVQAHMAFMESGVNPAETDPEGFRQRCARRIEQGRTWVWLEDGQLIFKADIMADTPQVIYLEGVYVKPEERGQGYGLRCLSQLSRKLLERAGCICLFVNERDLRSQAFYNRAGYKLSSYYDTIFLRKNHEIGNGH